MENERSSTQEKRRALPSLLDIYFREIARFPLLTAEAEQRLARQAAEGVDHARDQLILSNLRLVVKIAQEYTDTAIPLIDLIQEGNIGLMDAIDRFDPERGFRLSTYSAWWIRRSILLSINQHSRMIRIPDYLFRAVRRLAKLRATAENGETEDGEITEANGISADRLRRIEAQVSEIVSLDQVLGFDGDETLEDRIVDESGLSPEREALRLLFRDELEAVLGNIPARQALAIRLHYGIEDGCAYNFAEVGRIMEVSRERVRQLVREGMSTISDRWGEEAFETYRSLLGG